MAISIGDAVLEIGGDTRKLDKSLKGIGQKMTQVGKNLTLKLTAPLVAFGALSVKAAVDFEDAFAGVRKTVEATEEEFAVLKEGIRNLTKELPLTHTELAKIAESAGQLGIEKDNILDFTKVMAQLGLTTNMSGDEAATTFARFANITGMDTSFFDNLGSVIVDLGNNMATTEGEIAAMALRLAGAGTVIGLSQAEILGLAASLSSVGIRAEAGGTAFSRVMLEMNSAVALGGEALEQWADIAGVSVDEFRERFKEDAIGSVLGLIKGLGALKDQGVDITSILEDLGLGGIRITDALLRATGAQDLFTDAQEIAATAWEENTALQLEAQKRLDTTKSKMDILKNSLIDAGITIGELLVPKLQQFIDWLTPVIENVQQWIEDNPGLTDTLLKVAGALAILGPLIWGVGIAVKLLTGLKWLWMIAAKAVTAAQWLWNAALLANPVGLVIIGIVALGAAMAALGVLIGRHWNGILEFFVGIGEGIKAIFLRIAEFMYQPIRQAVDWIIGVINGMIRGLNQILGMFGLRLPEIGFRMPDLFAQQRNIRGATSREKAREERRAVGQLTDEEVAADIRAIQKGRELPSEAQEPTEPEPFDPSQLARGVTRFAHGGPILGPTLLTNLASGRPYAIAGEAGPERVVPSTGTNQMTIEVLGEPVLDILGENLVARIRTSQGLTV